MSEHYSSGRSVLLLRVIIKTDKSTIRTYKLRRVKCTRVNRRYSHRLCIAIGDAYGVL